MWTIIWNFEYIQKRKSCWIKIYTSIQQYCQIWFCIYPLIRILCPHTAYNWEKLKLIMDRKNKGQKKKVKIKQIKTSASASHGEK